MLEIQLHIWDMSAKKADQGEWGHLWYESIKLEMKNQWIAFDELIPWKEQNGILILDTTEERNTHLCWYSATNHRDRNADWCGPGTDCTVERGRLKSIRSESWRRRMEGRGATTSDVWPCNGVENIESGTLEGTTDATDDLNIQNYTNMEIVLQCEEQGELQHAKATQLASQTATNCWIQGSMKSNTMMEPSRYCLQTSWLRICQLKLWSMVTVTGSWKSWWTVDQAIKQWRKQPLSILWRAAWSEENKPLLDGNPTSHGKTVLRTRFHWRIFPDWGSWLFSMN